MSGIDIVILILTILLVLAIVFFSFIFPKIRGQKSGCSSCPNVKKAKRIFKDYKKSKDKGE